MLVYADSRLEKEAAFFDERARSVNITPAILRRYSRLRAFDCAEAVIAAMGSLCGKTVLDVGCGDGENAILAAKLGAHVTGIDLSPGSIESARRSAEANGVTCEFICGPASDIAAQGRRFDVVVCKSILHHLLPLDAAFLAAIDACVAPGGRLIIAEPMALVPFMRWLRRMIPIQTESTPDERPLQDEDMAAIRAAFPGIEIRMYGLLARLCRFRRSYEDGPSWQRTVTDACSLIDYWLLSVPGLSRLGCISVMTLTRR